MSKKIYITFLSVLSSFAVVALHVNGDFWKFSYEPYWISANIIESLFYFAVPIFFMITGATLVDYRERYTTKDFFKKRIRKTVFPFLNWSLIGLLYTYFVIKKEIGGINTIIEKIFKTKYVNIYWFFIPLFAAYIAIPFLTYINEKFRKQAFGYAIITAFVLNALLPLLFSIFNLPWNGNMQMPVVGGYIIYILLGYWIDKYELTKKQRYVIYILAIVGLLAHIIGTWYLSYKEGKIISTYKGYLKAPCILYSTGVFVLAKYIKSEKALNIIRKISAPFSNLTFGIYLVHWFLLDIIKRYAHLPTESLIYRTIGTVVVFLICSGMVYIIKKIPFLNELIPD